MPRYTLGLDYGTNSVRAIVVNIARGREIATAVWAERTAWTALFSLATRTRPACIAL